MVSIKQHPQPIIQAETDFHVTDVHTTPTLSVAEVCPFNNRQKSDGGSVVSVARWIQLESSACLEVIG